jgi:hypothetical protein
VPRCGPVGEEAVGGLFGEGSGGAGRLGLNDGCVDGEEGAGEGNVEGSACGRHCISCVGGSVRLS